MEDGRINLSEISFEQPEDQVNENEPIQDETETFLEDVPQPEPEGQVADTVTEPEEPVVESTESEKPAWMSEYEDADSMFAALNELKNAPKEEPTPKEDMDEFIKGAVEYYKKTGDLTAYLEVKSVDYDKMSDKDVFAKKLRSDYPNISNKAFERLLDKEITNRFGSLESEYEDEQDDETSLALELLKAEADKLRSNFKDQQEKFSAPEREEPESTEPTEEEMKAQAEATEKKLMSNPFIKEFMKNDTLKVKYGGEDFNYEPEDKDSMLNMTKDLNGFMQLFSTGDESNPVDFEKWFTVMAFAKNPDKFLKGVRTAAKAVGTQNVLDEIRNPAMSKTSNQTTVPQGSVREQLLQAALKAKK